MSGDHDHDHDHDRDHDDHGHGGAADEHEGIDRSTLSPYAYRIMAMRDLLVEQGVIAAEDVEAAVAAIERLTPTNGARLVARAWLDDGFRQRLLADTRSAAAELGIDLPEEPRITALENREDLHHVVVCTLCSDVHRTGTGASSTAHGSSSSRVRSSASSGSSWTPPWPSASSTARRTTGTSSSPCALSVPRGSASRSSSSSSRGMP
jgi:hypothetical protein